MVSEKKYFINKSYSSINLNKEFKDSLLNKQKKTLKTISTFPNIDLDVSPNIGLYYASDRTIYNSDLSNKSEFKGSQEQLKIGQIKHLTSPNKPYGTKQLKGFMSPKNFSRLSLPIMSKKPVNISPL